MSLHARLAGWLERAFNPIMVKELRASLRGARFFAAHFTILCLFAAGLLVLFAAFMSQNRWSGPAYGFMAADPALVGSRTYAVLQWIHLAVVVLVVPGFAAASITAEREKLTYEMLVSTTLTARQVIWGKFVAAMTQSFTVFVSLVPLVALCFLFGGVTVVQIVANYALDFVLSALMVMFALSISANSPTTQRATGTVYGMALVVGGPLAAVFLTGIHQSDLVREMAAAYGFVVPAEAGTARVPLIERLLYVYAMPAFGWAALFALFFINAINRLKPSSANRSTNLRIYYAVVVSGILVLVTAALHHETPPSSNLYDRATGLMAVVLSLVSAGLMSALFACEDPALPPGLAARAEGLRGAGRLLRILWPGSGSGVWYCVAANGLIFAVAFAALLPLTRGFDRGVWKGWPEGVPLAVAFTVAFLWAFLCASAGRLLSAWWPHRPVLIRATLVIAALILAIFPLLHWGIAHSIDREALDPKRYHGPATLALSPAAAVLGTLDLSTSRRDFPFAALGLPVPLLFGAGALAGGVAMLALASRRLSRLRSGPLSRETIG